MACGDSGETLASFVLLLEPGGPGPTGAARDADGGTHGLVAQSFVPACGIDGDENLPSARTRTAGIRSRMVAVISL